MGRAKTWMILFFFVFSVVVVIILSLRGADKVKAQTNPGLEKYSPTKLEWAVVQLNSYYRVRTQIRDGRSFFKREVRVRFEPKSPDTVVISVRYGKKIDRTVLNAVVEQFKKIVRSYARGKGFSWLKIDEKTQALK